MTGVALVLVPYAVGDERQTAAAGPERLVRTGLERALADRGMAVSVERVERRRPFRDSTSASLAVNEELARVVRDALASAQLPVVLAGSCDACLGVLAGFEHSRCGVVWIDAHADFNTPETTVSGFFPGMSAAVVTGHCYASLWAQAGESRPVAEEAVVMAGVRDLSPEAEHERLERSAIQVVPWAGGEPQGDVLARLDELRTRVEEVYLHVDLDAFDPRVAPGVADEPVAGGLSWEDGEAVVRAVADRFRITAAAVTTYDPERDEGEKTLRVAVRMVELLAECVA